MITVLARPTMERDSGTTFQAARVKEEADGESRCCITQASSSAWGDYSAQRPDNRGPSNASCVTSPDDLQEDVSPLEKKIKTEPKDDYALAEEECARNSSQISTFSLHCPEYREQSEAQWIGERSGSASPVFERVPSFAPEDAQKFMDSCKRCIINQSQSPVDTDSTSLHRRRQIRAFEQSGEEPLSNKIRVWKEKRLEKSLVRGRPLLRGDEEAMCLDLEKRTEQLEEGESTHHPSTRSRQLSSESEEGGAAGIDESDPRFGYLRYLLTRSHSATSPASTGDDNVIEEPEERPEIAGSSPQVSTVAPIPSQEIDKVMEARMIVPVSRKDETKRVEDKRVSRKRTRQNATVTSATRREKVVGRNDKTEEGSNKTKGQRNRPKYFENDAVNAPDFSSTLNRGGFEEANGVGRVENQTTFRGDLGNSELYISDIQRPYFNIPDDHQVTHINGVMSLPATRETRYGITLGELKRRTGYPEFLTRVDLIAYVRQSKSAGRALLDKYTIATAGHKSRPTILSKMCENEARVLGDGINKLNADYFPWKTLARIASNKIMEGGVDDPGLSQKLKAIQNTRTMLKEVYDLTVANKDILTMKTFEVASHTFGTANILNHLTIFDRLFEEYQNNLLFRRDVRNSQKL